LLASAKIRKLKSAKYSTLQEALAIWIGQINLKNGTATGEVMKERVKVNCKYCTLLLP
jgi:hypothetical protein